MKIKDYKCKCGSNDFMFMPKNKVENVIGIYCNQCGRWLKWADKNEKNLYKGIKMVRDNDEFKRVY